MSKTINSDLIRGNINTIILKALYGGDRYGYDIIKEIEEKSHGQYVLKQPTLYSCLKRLESQGFINAYWGEQSNGGRRKYYSLTDLGREVFVQSQDEYEYSRTIIDQLISERDYDLDSLERPAPATDEPGDEGDFAAFYEETPAPAEEEATTAEEEATAPEEEPATNEEVTEDETVTPAEESAATPEEEPAALFDEDTAEEQADSAEEQAYYVEDGYEDEYEDVHSSDYAAENEDEAEFDDEDYAADNIGASGSDTANVLEAYYDFEDEETPEEEQIEGAVVAVTEEEPVTPIEESVTPEAAEEPVAAVAEEETVASEEPALPVATEETQIVPLSSPDEEVADEDNAAIIDRLILSDDEAQSYTENMRSEKARTPENYGGSFRQSYDFPAETEEQYGFAVEDDSPVGNETASAVDYNTGDRLEPPEETTEENEFIRYDATPAYDYTSSPRSNNDLTYKKALGELVDLDDEEPEPAPLVKEPIDEEPGLSVKEKIQVRSFGRLSQSIRDLGENVKIRTTDNAAAREYNKRYYFFSNKLRLWQYGIMFLVMLVECLISFLVVKHTVGAKQLYETPLYISSIIFSVAFPLVAAIMYATDPAKRRRADFNFATSMIFRLIIMCQLMLIVYSLNITLGMPIGFGPQYVFSMVLPCVLATNVPVSAIIFNGLYRSKKFEVK